MPPTGCSTTLRANSVFQVLAEPLVPRIEIALDKPFKLEGAGVDLGLTVEAFAVPGKVALYLEDKSSSNFGSQEGDTIGLKITDPAEKKSFFYIPGCAAVDEKLAAPPEGRIDRLLRRHPVYRRRDARAGPA